MSRVVGWRVFAIQEPFSAFHSELIALAEAVETVRVIQCLVARGRRNLTETFFKQTKAPWLSDSPLLGVWGLALARGYLVIDANIALFQCARMLGHACLVDR